MPKRVGDDLIRVKPLLRAVEEELLIVENLKRRGRNEHKMLC